MYKRQDKSIEDALLELHIVPMAVSYEYDPCDMLKANELLHIKSVSYTHLRAHETVLDLVCRLLLDKKNLSITILYLEFITTNMVLYYFALIMYGTEIE